MSSDYAYVAGFLDGDGSIYISQHTRNVNDEKGYRLVVSFSNTSKIPLDEIQRILGQGMFSAVERPDIRHKTKLEVKYNNKDALSKLEVLLPFLVLKKRQAELAFEFMAAKEAVDYEKQKSLWEQMTELNRRGKGIVKEKNICNYKDCSHDVYGKGLCKQHYRWVYESTTYKDNKGRKCLNCSNDLPTNARIDSKFCCKSCKMKYHRREGCYAPENKVFDAPKCSKEGCDKFAHGRGLCRAHYMRARRLNELPTVSQSVIMS